MKQDRLKVLHVVLGLDVGGLEKFVLDLVASYQNDIDSHIVCLNKAGVLAESFNLEKTYLVDENNRFKKSRKIAQLVRKLDIDLVHSHNPSPHFCGLLASKIAKVPLVHTKHGRNYPGVWRKVLLNCLLARFSNRVVPVSTDALNVCRDIEKIPENRLAFIANGIDVKRFSPRGEVARVFIPGSVCIGIVARLSREKNHLFLLNACRSLLESGKDVGLLIVGDGALRGDLENQAKAFGIQNRTVFVGMQENIPSFLRRMDVFVLPSLTEGMSLTLLEAMACGLPVVATDVGGNSEVVVHGETGFIVPSNDVAALAGSLQKLIENPPLRAAMGQKGRIRVEENFSIQKTARQYVQLYRDVLNGK